MSAGRPSNMRTSLLLLLLLLTSLTGTVRCTDKKDVPETDGPKATPAPKADPEPEPDKDPKAAPQPSSPTIVTNRKASTPPGATVKIDSVEDGSGTTSVEEGSGTSSDLRSVNTTPSSPEVEQNLGFIIIPAAVVLVFVIIGMIVCGIAINRWWGKKTGNQELEKEDPYLDESNTEKVPMPMFEEDVPSVLELEMEDFDQLMKKDVETAEESKLP